MTRRTVFVDTWAFVAAAVDDDPDHARVVALVTALRTEGAVRVTTRYVLAEALTRLRYDASLAIAVALSDAVEEMISAGTLELAAVDDTIWADAVRWFGRYADQRFSFVDCISFAVMASRGWQEALTADRHFATAGFTPLGA